MSNSIYGKPTKLSDFKKIPVKYRNDKTPSQLLALHNKRVYKTLVKPLSVMEALKLIKDNDAINPDKIPNTMYTIKIGSNRVNYLSRIYDHKKKNYTNIQPCFQRSYLKSNNMGRYSSSCRYTRYTYTPMIQSFGYLISSNTMYFRIDTDDGIISRVIKAPRGFHFSIDHLGIKIQSNSIKSMDYHFTAIDLLPYAIKKNDYKSGQLMAAIAKDNYQTRKQANLKSAIFSADQKQVARVIKEAERLKVQISIVDSIKAGNCLSGTESWIEANKLEKKHYPVNVIGSRINNDYRVKIAILRAIERTKQELSRGYSILQDHYLDYQTN